MLQNFWSFLVLVQVIGGGGLEPAEAACGPDMESTLLIVQTLCQPGNHEDDVAKLFYGCYDNVPGRVLFARCQLEVFGALMNSKENIANICQQGGQLPTYATCLGIEFASAQMDLTAAVTVVNACQGELLGTC